MVKAWKRGSSKAPAGGGAAAALIGIITLVIILYIVLLPTSERDSFLDTTTTSSSSSSSGSGGDDTTKFSDSKLNELVKVLLKENPKKIDFFSMQSVEHTIPSVNLVTRKEGSILEEEASIYVRNALFSEKLHEVSFEIDDLDNVENVLLNFKVKDAKGRLTIKLNEIEIYNNEATETTLEPISLKKTQLKNLNKIVFSVSSPGVAFWKVNEYTLENIAVTADVTDTSGRKAVSVFTTDSVEVDNLDKIKVRFTPECGSDEIGKLTARLNSNTLFSGIPDCGTPFIQEYAPYYLVDGENRIEFMTDSGSYLIDTIEVSSKLKEPRDYTYDFTVNKTIFQAVEADQLNVNLSLEFVDTDNKDKEAQLVINGRKIVVDTSDNEWDRLIDIYIEDDFNYIKIIPKSDMFVSELKIETQKK